MRKLFGVPLLVLAAVIAIYIIFKPNQIVNSITCDSNQKSGDYLVLVNKNHQLSSDYTPESLTIPNVNFTPYTSNEEKMMQEEAARALEKLFKSASKENMKLYGLSGYRSYESQKQVYDKRVKKVGRKQADEYVAHPGASEHQTGLAMDLTNEEGSKGKLKVDFGQTKEGQWVKSNGQNFGFIMRYPKEREDVTGYRYESWHIRYVGVKVAKEIFNKHMVLEEFLNKK